MINNDRNRWEQKDMLTLVSSFKDLIMKYGRASVLDITRTLDGICEGTRKESKKHGKKKCACASLLGTKRCTFTYGISISEILFNLKCKHIIIVLILEYKQ